MKPQKYQVGQSVILLEVGTRLPAVSAKIQNYEPQLALPYRIQYQLPGSEIISFDDVSEDRLTTMLEIGLQHADHPALHPLFEKLFSQYLVIIEQNRKAFVAYDSRHENETAHKIFSTYWSLEAHSSSIESERLKLTRKEAFVALPDELRKLIR